MSKDKFTAEDLRKRDEVLDRIRGGPRQRLIELAAECELSYEDFMNQLKEISQGGERIHLGFDTPNYDAAQVWADYELVTGEVVPQDAKTDWLISCAC